MDSSHDDPKPDFSAPALPRSFGEIVLLWEKRHELDAEGGFRPGSAALWLHRNRIPSDYWAKLVRAAKARGFDQVTHDLLSELEEARSSSARDVA